MADFTIAPMAGRYVRLRDLHAGIEENPWNMEPLLEWAERDERDRGLGEMPYPPNFPKQRASRRGTTIAHEQGQLVER